MYARAINKQSLWCVKENRRVLLFSFTGVMSTNTASREDNWYGPDIYRTLALRQTTNKLLFYHTKLMTTVITPK